MSIIDSPAGARRIKLGFLLSLVTTAVTACFFLAVGQYIDATIPLAVPIILAIVAAVLTVSTGYLAEVGAKKEEVSIRGRLLDSWWKKAGQDHKHASTGRVVSLMTDSVERVTVYRQGFLAGLMGAGISPLVVLVVVAIGIDWLSALILLAFIPVIPLCINGFQKAFKKVSAESRDARAALANRYLESIQGLETLVMLNAAARTERELADVGEHNRVALMRLLSRNQLILFVSDAVFSLSCVTTAGVLAAWRFANANITFGEAVALVLCAILLIGPLEMIGAFFYVGMGGRAAQKGMEKFGLGTEKSEDAREERGSDEYAGVDAGRGGRGATDSYSGTITFNGAQLGYGENVVLQDVNLRLPSNSTTVITGPSGGGKSTMLAAMKGLVFPQAGEILVGGQVSTRGRTSVAASADYARATHVTGSAHSSATSNTAQASRTPNTARAPHVSGSPQTSSAESGLDNAPTGGYGDNSLKVRNASALVAQITWLFSGSVADNLRLVKPDATDKDMWNALKLVDLDGFVRLLPEELDTNIGELGQGLSGGQAQRLSLARALLSGRRIILLDEPTSQVDLESEEVIMHALGELQGSRTLVLVTHRASAQLPGATMITVDDGAVTLSASGETAKGSGGVDKEEEGPRNHAGGEQ